MARDDGRRLSGRARIALTIAGSDSGGGAGVQADLKTFAALGVHGACAITAITAQNTRGVRAVFAASAEAVAAQIAAVLEDFEVGAIKTGMFGGAQIVEAVARAIRPARESGAPVVCDPVLRASSGDALGAADLPEALRTHLFPLVDCLTPNLSEAAALLGEPQATTEAEMARQGAALLRLGPRAVLMKGGHLPGAEAVDLLLRPSGALRFARPRSSSRNLHGTGCTLSAAIAAWLARGAELAEAVGAAKAFVVESIARGEDVALGAGPGPLLQSPLATR